MTDIARDQFATEVLADPQSLPGNHRPSWCQLRWIHLQGRMSEALLGALSEKYHIHPLAHEELLAVGLRPKVEDFPASTGSPGRLFVIVRELSLIESVLVEGQIAIFVGRSTVLTFQERFSPVFDPVYRHLEFDLSRARLCEASLLCHGLVDTLVSSYFPILEHYSHRIDVIEEGLVGASTPEMIAKAHAVKRGLLMLRRTVWPMREVVSQLQREGHECLTPSSQPYFRDVYDHCVQILDLNETYHEITVSLTEAYISVISNRMNEVVKVLTIISTIFMPLSFIAGVYGMNMPIPENHSEYAYPLFWVICAVIAIGMMIFFRRKGWI